MRKTLIIAIIVIVVVLLVVGAITFLSTGNSQDKVFTSYNSCNSECLNRGYDQGSCDKSIIIEQGKEYKYLGECHIEDDLACSNLDNVCRCTCIR